MRIRRNLTIGAIGVAAAGVVVLLVLPALKPARTSGPGHERKLYTALDYRPVMPGEFRDTTYPHVEIPRASNSDDGRSRNHTTSSVVSEEWLGVAEGALRTLATRVLYEETRGLRFLFADPFEGTRFPQSVPLEPAGTDVREIQLDPSPEPLIGKEEFLRSFRGYLSTFDSIRDLRLKPLTNRVPDGGKQRLELTLAIRIWGRQGSAMRHDVITCEASMEVIQGFWRLTTCRATGHRIQFSPYLHFIERTAELGIATDFEDLDMGTLGLFGEVKHNGGLALADIDNDGDLDLYLAREGPNILYRNDGGRFTDVSAESGAADDGDSRATVFADFDNDGDKDLFVANRGRWGFTRLSALYWNMGGGRFRRAEPGAFPPAVQAATCVAVADYDNDGLLDIYLGQYPAAAPDSNIEAGNGQRDLLLRNNGDGTFSDVTDAVGMTARGYTLAAAWADYDGDHWPDLYVSFDFGRNVLYRNNGDGTFSDAAERAGVSDIGNGMGVNWVDYDNDGDLDLYSVNMSSTAGKRVLEHPIEGLSDEDLQHLKKMARGNSLLRNNGNGTFSDVSVASGSNEANWGWGAVFFDYDNDTDLDILACNGYWSGPDARDI